MYICTKCFYSGKPLETRRENTGGISGFISAVFSSNSKIEKCPHCDNQNLISLSTDEGKRLLDSITK